MKAIQLFMFSASLLITIALFIGAFFNPIHFVMGSMSAYLTWVFFKEKRW
ncbi:hypothetical protein [Parabacteroides hominis]|uniref:Uncharacterized protein n=1 Tax=Parabacteroides hominis TaxID=2763057 RepID=A0ABR7DL56_9BACT|nr:hypothetical protein [Parabacteroides hominis]MBC5632077.1 hypothetical protein [Parabacteroides hominis]